MQGFIYYVPRKPGEKVEYNVLLPRSRGIGYAFDDECGVGEVMSGPDGKPGFVMGVPRRTGIPQYKKDTQHWRQIPKSDAWVGWQKEGSIHPVDLVRKELMDGHNVRLADGNSWLCPMAVAPEEREGVLCPSCRLPMGTTIDEEGEWIPTGVAEGYQRLWAYAVQWWSAMGNATIEIGDDTATSSFDFNGLNDAALHCLQRNYRVGKLEVSILGLFNNKVATEILKALIDWPTVVKRMESRLKKEMAVGSSTEHGPAASTPAIDQP